MWKLNNILLSDNFVKCALCFPNCLMPCRDQWVHILHFLSIVNKGLTLLSRMVMNHRDSLSSYFSLLTGKDIRSARPLSTQ